MNIADNNGGGIYNYTHEKPAITNCIFWNNSPDDIIDRFSSSPSIVTYCDIEGSHPGTGNISGVPLFVNPGSGDFHLLPNSPCIDAGSNSAVSGIARDFDGDDRIIDGNNSGTSTVDIGIDEYGVKVGVYVTLQGDNRPIDGWEVPLTVGFFEPGVDVLTATPVYSFAGTTTMIVNGVTRAYFECPQSVAPGTYDITADTTTTLLNVKRLVGVW